MYKCLISIHKTFLQYFQKNFNTISCNVSRFECNEYLKKYSYTFQQDYITKSIDSVGFIKLYKVTLKKTY